MCMDQLFSSARLSVVGFATALFAAAAVSAASAPEVPESALIQERMDWAEQFLLEQGVEIGGKFETMSVERLQKVLDRWVAQSRSLPAPKTPPKEWLPGSVSDLLPTQTQRLGQIWKWNVNLEDQPNRLFTTEGSGDASRVRVIDNPSRYLTKITLSISPGELFTSPADLQAAYSNLGNYANLGVRFSLEDEKLQVGSPDEKLDYLKRTRKRDWIGRLFSAVSVSLSLGERSRLDGTLLIPDDEHIETFNFKFDPSKLLPGPADLKTAYAALKSYADNFHHFTADTGTPPSEMKKLVEKSPCPGIGDGGDSKPSPACFERLQKDSGWVKALRIILPTVEFGSKDEFDFVKAGNRFLPFSSLREKSLETLTLSWDLKSIFDVMKRKSDALAIAKTHGEIWKKQERYNRGAPSIDPAHLRAPAEGQFYYHQLQQQLQPEEKALSDLSWALIGSDGKPTKDSTAFPGVRLESDGTLIGYPAAAGEYPFTVRLSDPFDRSDQRRYVVKVYDPSLLSLRRKVADSYLALRKSPPLIADVSWFEAFRSNCRALESLAAGTGK